MEHLAKSMSASCILHTSPARTPVSTAAASRLHSVRRAVLVGFTGSRRRNPVTKPDGTVVRTLWGELASSAGRNSYARVVRRRRACRTSPGDACANLVDYGPCLVLISVPRSATGVPNECREADYEKRIKDAFRIHPECVRPALHRLVGAGEVPERTRGVLRQMAAVIHHQWERGDRSPLILPGSIALEDARIQSELARYLDDNWTPIIEKDVDGADSTAVADR